MRLYVIPVLCLLIGCSMPDNESTQGQTSEKNDAVAPVEDDTIVVEEMPLVAGYPKQLFDDFFFIFSRALDQKDAEKLTGIIHPEFGLYIIESPGAIPLINRIDDPVNYQTISTGKRLLEMEYKNIVKYPKFEPLPKVICDENVYDKQGFFAASPDRFKQDQIWTRIDLDKIQLKAIEEVASTVELTLINTSNYTFHFSVIGGQWYLTFIDLRAPCSA